jgi:hypothetical protein
MKYWKHLNYYVIAVILIIIIYILFGIPDDLIFFFTNLLIIVICTIGLREKNNKRYSLEKVFYLFNLFFMAIIPLNDFNSKNIYISGGHLTNLDYYVANTYLIIGFFFFQLGHKIQYRLLFNTKYHFVIRRPSFLFHAKLCMIYLFCCFLIFQRVGYDFFLLIVRPNLHLGQDIYSFESNSTEGFFLSVVKPLPIFVLLFYYTLFKESIKSHPGFMMFHLFLLISSIIFVSPVSVTRFVAGTLFLMLFLVYQRERVFSYMFELGFLLFFFFVFPMMDTFRYFNPVTFEWRDLIRWNFDFINNGDFDAYQNFALSISREFISFGKQLLVVIFFFIPRTIWQDKPVGSGVELTRILHGADNTNISMPFISEGYVNFGLLGIILFLFLLGWIIGILDNIYWYKRSRTLIDKPFNIFYFFSLGYLTFLLRGDLLSSFSYFIGFILCFLIVYVLFFRLKVDID